MPSVEERAVPLPCESLCCVIPSVVLLPLPFSDSGEVDHAEKLLETILQCMTSASRPETSISKSGKLESRSPMT